MDGGWIVIIVIVVSVAIALAIWRARARRPAPTVLPPAEPAQPAATEAPVAVLPAPPAPPIVEVQPIETPPVPMAPVEAQPVQPLPVIEPVAPLPPPMIESFQRPAPMPTIPQFLEATTAEGKLKRFAIDRPQLSIGRALDNDLVIGDELTGASSVTAHHARIELRENYVVVEPVSAEAPTFVNGQQVGRSILRNGWRLTLGEVDLSFRTAGLGTAPLAEPEHMPGQSGEGVPRPSLAAGFAPLPDGAVLGNRYVVLEPHAETSLRNLYIVESMLPVLNCPQCGFETAETRQRVCRTCGAPLAEALPFYPHYRIKETAHERDLDAERQLIGLSHPNALLPRFAFAETPFGNTPRYYIVEPEAPQLAATLRAPQELPQVLEWTQQLAQGMAYLHNNGVSLGPIDLWRIAIEGTLARWVDFSACEFVAESERFTRFSAEAHTLAEVAYYLITGKRHYDESIQISPPGVGMLFDRMLCGLDVLSADKFAAALQAGLVEVRRPSSMDVRVGRLSDVGQVRQLNEDSLLTVEVGRVRRSISEPIGLYAVCDGMGGQAAGDVASSLAVQTLARKALAEVMSDGVADTVPPNWESWLRGALQEANQAVFGRRRAAGNDMGTTCVAALVYGDKATIAHAGDSRCYLVNGDGIQQVTQDHSLVQRLVQLGQLTPTEARTHPRRNVIYKNLGDKTVVEPDVITRKLAGGDWLLLCSDGLSTMVEDDVIRQTIQSASSPQQACRQLVEAANHAGGEDNVSVVLIQVEALD
jgi:serine/threonine protein phosphatase PrpC